MSGVTPAQERRALALRKAGKSFDEIAATLGLSKRTVRAILHILSREGVDVSGRASAPRPREYAGRDGHERSAVEQLADRVEALEARVAALEGATAPARPR